MATCTSRSSGPRARCRQPHSTHSGDDRERGRTDEYNLLGADIGPVTSIIPQFRLAGSSNWCLNDVVIIGPHGLTVHPFNGFVDNNANIEIGAA